MLARVKWVGEWDDKRRTYNMEYGTLLQIVYCNNDAHCFIAVDGHDNGTRGAIIRKPYETVRVTSWFKW